MQIRAPRREALPNAHGRIRGCGLHVDVQTTQRLAICLCFNKIAGMDQTAQSHTAGGPLFLYSTAPTLHVRQMLLNAAQHRAQTDTSPLRCVVLQTPVEQPTPETIATQMQIFGTQGIPIEMEDAMLHTREDAHRLDVIARINQADAILLTGGSPERAYRETHDTPALDALFKASCNGKVIVACSAGALLVGRGMMGYVDGKAQPLELWGWLNRVIVAPHFGNYDIETWRRAFPDCWVLGIPDDAMAFVHPGWEQIESLGPAPLHMIPPDATTRTIVPAGQTFDMNMGCISRS
jgi:putative intracellular protease/amidase